MMKKLLLVLSCLVVSLANAVQVKGEGSTFEEAKQNAFRAAVEFHVGTLVISERESHNFKPVKEEILVYSAGYVDDYKIISQSREESRVSLIIDVNVSSQKIAQRIIGKGIDTKIFNSDRHLTQYQTYLYEREQGDKILQNVLNDYPSRAYNIDQKQYSIQIDGYRNAIINIPYHLTWNFNYLTSLNSVLAILEEGKQGFMVKSVGNVVIMAKNPKDWVVGEMNHYRFNDLVRTNNIVNTLVDKQVRIKTSILNRDNNVIMETCISPNFVMGYNKAFYDIGEPNTAIFYGNIYEDNVIRLSVAPIHYNLLNDIFSIKLQIASNSSC